MLSALRSHGERGLLQELGIKERNRRSGEEAGNLRKVIRAFVASEGQITQEGGKSVTLSAGGSAKRGVEWGRLTVGVLAE